MTQHDYPFEHRHRGGYEWHLESLQSAGMSVTIMKKTLHSPARALPEVCEAVAGHDGGHD